MALTRDHETTWQNIPTDSHACHEYNELSRREFLARTTASAIALVDAGMAAAGGLRASASTARDVIVSIFLRGGADGLTLVVPFAETAYYTLRPTIAIPRPDSSNANRASISTASSACRPRWRRCCRRTRPGICWSSTPPGSTDPTRSHFDAQAYMEVGVPARRPRDRLARPPPRQQAADEADAALRALAFNFGLPLTLAGAPDTLPIPDPGNFGLSGSSSTRDGAARLARRTPSPGERDPLKAVRAEHAAHDHDAAAIEHQPATCRPAARSTRRRASAAALRSTAALIRADVGVEAVQIDVGGWDTHSAQGPLTGGMATNMRTLARRARGVPRRHRRCRAAWARSRWS